MRVTAKRVFRFFLVLLLVLLIVYLAVLGAANPQTVDLLFFIPLPTAWVVGIALLLGFVFGWVSLASRVLGLQRENRSLRQRLIRAGLETPHTTQTPGRSSLKPRDEMTRF